MIRNGNIERNYPSVDDGTATGVCQDHTIRYEFAKQFTKGKKVLDAACGVGYGSVILEAEEYVGYDVSEEAVGYGLKNFSSPSRSFQLKNLDEKGWSDGLVHFDVLVCFETIEHLNNPLQFLQEACSKFKTVIVSTPVALPGKHGMHSPYHTQEWYTDEFVQLCGEASGSTLSVEFFWQFDDGFSYIKSFGELNQKPDNGVIISVITP